MVGVWMREREQLDAYAIDEDASRHSAPFGALVSICSATAAFLDPSLLATTTTTTTTTAVSCLLSALRFGDRPSLQIQYWNTPTVRFSVCRSCSPNHVFQFTLPS